jgi:hypothetical protein
MDVYKEAADFFCIRDVKVNSPANAIEIELLRSACAIPVDEELLRLYSTFNGFIDDDFDAQSFISIWPIQKIIEFPNASNCISLGILPFADFSLSSFVYGIPFAQVKDSLYECGKMSKIGINLSDFLVAFTKGRFDRGGGIEI